jgi:hypothetical protein
MLAMTRRALALFVDRATRAWIVRDGEGNFWTLPSGPNSWERREPFTWSADSDLTPVPGHYQYLLELPQQLE